MDEKKTDDGAMRVVKGSEGQWMFDAGPHLMAASCHHRKNRDGFSACGGCYARAFTVLEALADEGHPKAQQAIAAVQAEAKS